LVSRKVKHKRNRIALIALLPALIFIGAVGWCMYAFGDNHKTTQGKPSRLFQQDNVTLLPIPLENQQEIRINNSTKQ